MDTARFNAVIHALKTTTNRLRALLLHIGLVCIAHQTTSATELQQLPVPPSAQPHNTELISALSQGTDCVQIAQPTATVMELHSLHVVVHVILELTNPQRVQAPPTAFALHALEHALLVHTRPQTVRLQQTELALHVKLPVLQAHMKPLLAPAPQTDFAALAQPTITALEVPQLSLAQPYVRLARMKPLPAPAPPTEFAALALQIAIVLETHPCLPAQSALLAPTRPQPATALPTGSAVLALQIATALEEPQ
jgi:hypothetical protein